MKNAYIVADMHKRPSNSTHLACTRCQSIPYQIAGTQRLHSTSVLCGRSNILVTIFPFLCSTYYANRSDQREEDIDQTLVILFLRLCFSDTLDQTLRPAGRGSAKIWLFDCDFLCFSNTLGHPLRPKRIAFPRTPSYIEKHLPHNTSIWQQVLNTQQVATAGHIA